MLGKALHIMLGELQEHYRLGFIFTGNNLFA